MFKLINYYLLFPFHLLIYVIGWIVGYLGRTTFTGFSHGYFYLEIREQLKVQTTLEKATEELSKGKDINEIRSELQQ
jgi:hypothetical protein